MAKCGNILMNTSATANGATTQLRWYCAIIPMNEFCNINVGLMVKCTPERGQKCSLFHLMVKCTPIIVELPSVYRGCKPLICFQ